MPIQAPGANSTDMINLNVSLQYLNKSPTAALFLQNLNFSISIDANGPTIALPLSGQVLWNPSQGLQVISAAGVLGVQSPAMGLLHEIAHIIFGYDEAQATAFETIIANELGEPTRENYNAIGADVKVKNPTQHTENGQWSVIDILGNKVTGSYYDGTTNSPDLGWAGSVGGSSGGNGAGGSAGGGGGGSGGVQLPGYDPGPKDGSYPVQPGHPPHTYDPMSLPSDPTKLDESFVAGSNMYDVGIELSLIGVQEIAGF